MEYCLTFDTEVTAPSATTAVTARAAVVNGNTLVRSIVQTC